MATEKIEKVLANVVQNLTTEEQAQARANIGAAAASDIPANVPEIVTLEHNQGVDVETDVSKLTIDTDFGTVKADQRSVGVLPPVPASGDTGKVAVVNGDSLEYQTPTQEVPTPGASDLTKSLQVTGTSGEYGWRTQSEVRLKSGGGSGVIYSQLKQLTVGTGRSEVYGVKDGEDTVTMLGLICPYPTSSDDTGKFLRCTYSPNNNCYTTWANPEPICDLKILETQNVHYTTGGNKTLTIADEYSYNIVIDAPVVVTLATNSTDTLHSVISVKTSATNVCAGIEIVWYDETLSEHGLTVDLTETNKTFFFDVYIRKVYTQSSSYSIARLYDFPCAYRQSPFTSSNLDNNTNFIGRWM